jgi:RNA polymerase sigma-70 factor (ECF subfamily)
MSHVLDDDREMEQLRRRGKEALPDLFGRYRSRLLRMIALRLDCRLMAKVDSEDILQEVFIEVGRRLPQYLSQPAVPIFVWLRQLTCQVLIDTHRRFLATRRRNVNQEVDLYWAELMDAGSASLVAQLADSLTTPSQCVVREEAVAEVRALLERLDPIDREVLFLRHLEELSNKEVAQVLGIDPFAASKRYLRALARLRSMMPVET